VFIDPRFSQKVAHHSADRRLGLAVFGAAALLIAYSILFRFVDHDEGQYVAAIALMRDGWPYLDFAYLQTPLQPLLLAPLSLVPAGWLLVAARCANGLFAFATLLLLYVTLEKRAGRRSALIAIASLACTESFLLAGALARNDALPMMLLAGAILALLTAIERKDERVALALAGALFGLAASAKISFAVPAAGAGLFLLLRAREFGARGLAAFGIGALAGLAPSLVFAIAAPEQFRFGVFSYSLEAPRQWWTYIGQADALVPSNRIVELLRLAAQGAILPALAAAALDRRRSDDRLLLDLMILGGVAGAYMPEPPFSQYLVPLLPALFVRFGIALHRPHWKWTGPVLALTAAGSIGGLYDASRFASEGPAQGSDLVRAVRDGRQLSRLADGGRIVTLSPQLVAGADTNLDRRFVTGPFLFRTYGELSARALRHGYSPNWQRLDTALAARPPAVILVGGESRPRPPLFPMGLDAPLVRWARTHGFARVQLSGGNVAFVSER
jgi:4-amino-4-deoxy-L-arabinose transferase-like glycosyltransferase